MHIAEHCPRTLVEQVRIEAIRPQQGDAMLPLRALGLDAGKLGRELADLLDDILLRPQAVSSDIGIDAEIADQQRRADVETERTENVTQPRAGDHGRSMRAWH